MDVKTLHSHIRDGDIKAVGRLVDYGVDVNQIHCRDTAFSLALDQNTVNDDIVQLLLSSSKFDSSAKNHYDKTPLFCAAKFGNIDIVNHLLSLDVSVNAADLDGVTPLGATAWYDSVEAARALIRVGANINSSDKRGETPLLRACSNGSFNVAKVLLESGCDVNIQALDFRSPLMACIPSSMCTRHPCEKTDLLRLLLKYNCDTNLQDRSGCSALHLCVFQDQLLSACILAERGCDMTLKNNDKMTAFDTAISPGRQNFKFATCFISYGFNVQDIFPEIESDSGPISMILNGLTTPNTCPKATSTERKLLLHLLLWNLDHSKVNKSRLQKLLDSHVQQHGPHNDLEMITKYCLDRFPDLLQKICRRKIRRILGQNVIHSVPMLPVCPSLKRFLTFGLDHCQRNPIRLLELQQAVINGHVEKILRVQEEGADINFAFLGNTPLLVAIEYGQNASLQALLSVGADPNILGFEGDNVLHIAARFGRKNMLNFFLKRGHSVSNKNKKGNLPIHEACQRGNFASARLLLSHGSPVSLPDHSKSYPIHCVAASGNMETLHQIIAEDSAVDMVDLYGNTPLHLAASYGILYLKQNIPLPSLYSSELTMNLDMMDIIHTGRKTLGSAANAGKEHKKVVKELLNAGASKTIENTAGQTPLDVAVEFGCLEYFEMENDYIT
ncbi:poly [ADP-ribose] polymerase tankyrase-2-like [Argopecten irradians]|uniref:poly [ADP-ribose] polymerase tankyrase-2-like n=1 Tax=Argopecten irradians TaxID=31199 RepID=UPI0037113281